MHLGWFLRYDAMLVISEASLMILLFRMACASSLQSGLIHHLLAGLWLGMAAWIAGSLLHAWVPLWQILLIGLAASSGCFVFRQRLGLAARSAADLLVIASLGVLSVIPVSGFRVAAAAIAFMMAGYALDRLTRRLTPRTQQLLLLMPIGLTALMGLWVMQADDFGSRLLARDPLFPMRLALAAPLPGERVRLPSGAAAWLLKVPGDKSIGTAIFLHGNNPGAAHQPAALAMQGALLRAGFDAMSVEMPGYGSSPAPDADAALTAWDPTVGPQQALALIHAARPTHSTPTIIVAHSAGVDVALQWLRSGVAVQEAYLFSGALAGPPLSAKEAAELFHRERQMPCCRPEQAVKEITDRFYASADRYAAELPRTHPFIQFVQMGIEYGDVAATRQRLYAAISPPKAVCTVTDVTHYMNTLALRRFTLLDTSAVKRLARLFSAPDSSAKSGACAD
jgi:pimeloyl-ACP methyl ester carboxylesterase